MISVRMEMAFYLLNSIASNDITSVTTMTAATGKSTSSIEQSLTPLRRAGLITSVRGAGGGYSLARPLTDIRVKDLADALDMPRRSNYDLQSALYPLIAHLTLAQLTERTK